MILENLLKILRTRTFSQSSLTISATIINGILGLIFYILLAKNLGPLSLGAFAFTVAALTLIADIGDLGTDTGLIRFVGKYINEKQITLKLLKLSLEIKLLVWILVLILGWILSPIIMENIFKKPQLLDPLRLGLIGVGGALLFSFINHSIQAFQKYKVWGFLLVGSNSLRLLLIFVVILFLKLNLFNSLEIYIFVPFLFFIIGFFFLPRFILVKNEFSVASEFFSFNKWVFLISVVAATGARIDTFLTTRFSPIESVGIYSVAVSLTSFIPQLFFAIATVIAPKLASFSSEEVAAIYLKKLQLLCLGVAFLGLTGIPIGHFLINHFYGIEYGTSFTPFVILYIAQLIFLLALPVHQAIFYYFAKPKIMVPVSIIQFVIVIILGWWLINLCGIIGAAISVLIGNVFLFIAPAIWVIFNFKKK